MTLFLRIPISSEDATSNPLHTKKLLETPPLLHFKKLANIRIGESFRKLKSTASSIVGMMIIHSRFQNSWNGRLFSKCGGREKLLHEYKCYLRGGGGGGEYKSVLQRTTGRLL